MLYAFGESARCCAWAREDQDMPNEIARAVLVTGGAQRIGGAIAQALARAGYAVAVHANRSTQAAQKLCDTIVASGGKAKCVEGDLSDHGVVSALIGNAATAIGPLTLLVNNAGEFELDTFGDLDRALFDRQIAVN